MLTATDLRTEYLTDPLGIDLTTPRLFWTCTGAISQSAYQVVARRGDELVWDSGKVASSRMAGVEWGGPTLASRDAVVWEVRLWDEDDRPGPWSRAGFEIGLLDGAHWSATWVTGDYRPRKKERYPVDHFRKVFDLADVGSARLYITACGLYRATLNGRRVGDFVLAPGFTSYQRRLHYQAYDVTDLLVAGENVLEVEVADGWYRGSVGAMGVRNAYGTETRLLAQLEVRGEDGGLETIVTDDSWEWSDDGPIRFADLQDGEVVDLRRKPTYGGHARRTTCSVAPSAANNVTVREHERFTPVASRAPSGKQLLDFGQNIAGYVDLRVDGHAGDALTLRFAERLDENGELDLSSVQVRAGTAKATPKQEVHLTLAEGSNRYRVSFAVFGFRYVEVDSEITLDPADIQSVAVYSDMRRTATFTCSDELVNKLVENTLWSMKGNFLDVPTDCPTRERSPWTGDIQIFARTGTYLMDTAAFLRKWLGDLRDRQGSDGRVPCIVPDTRNNEFLPGIDFLRRMDGSPGWADAAVLVPVRLYELYRDQQVLADSYASMKAHVEFQVSRTGRRGLFATTFPEPDRRFIPNVGQAFGEWLEPIDVHHQGLKDVVVPQPEVATAYLAHACALMVEVAQLLGHDDDAARFEELRDGARRAYANQFTPATTRRQSKLVRPLAFGLLDGQAAADTADRLVESIEERQGRIGTGFLSTPLVLPLLTRLGRTDLAYRMLENRSAPGWLHEVLSGATTVWEDWEGRASQNHYSLGSCCQWLFETVCGVDVVDVNTFRIAPQPGGSLTHASLSYDSVFGRVTSAWERADDSVRYTVTVPANTTADIQLPGGTRRTVGAGTWELVEDASAVA